MLLWHITTINPVERGAWYQVFKQNTLSREQEGIYHQDRRWQSNIGFRRKITEAAQKKTVCSYSYHMWPTHHQWLKEVTKLLSWIQWTRMKITKSTQISSCSLGKAPLRATKLSNFPYMWHVTKAILKTGNWAAKSVGSMLLCTVASWIRNNQIGLFELADRGKDKIEAVTKIWSVCIDHSSCGAQSIFHVYRPEGESDHLCGDLELFTRMSWCTENPRLRWAN